MDYIFTAKESITVENSSSVETKGKTSLAVIMRNVGNADFALWEDIGDTLNEIYTKASIDATYGEWAQLAMLSMDSENLIPTPTPYPTVTVDLVIRVCEEASLNPQYVTFSVTGGLRSQDQTTYLPTLIYNWMVARFASTISYMIVSAICEVKYIAEESEVE